MTNFKRFSAAIAATLMAATLSVPMMATYAEGEETTVSYSMTLPSLPTGSSISSVNAYKIFSGEYNSANNTFNVIDWASDTTLSSILSELPDGEVKTALSADGLTAQAVAEIIAGYANDLTNLEIFAKAAAEALTTGGVAGTVLGATTVETTDDAVQFDKTALGVGYYVVVCEVKKGTTEGYDAKSLGMLTVTGADKDYIGVDGNAKVGLPEVIKKVQEDDDITAPDIKINNKDFDADEIAKYNDVADYNIGDKVPFKLYGSLPVDLDNYSTYYYKFTDTLGNEFGSYEDLKVYAVNGDVATEIPASNNYTLVPGADTNDFAIEFTDVKNLLDASGTKITVDKSTIITVEYKAELLSNAVIGLPGQENSVNLTYSNNPNNAGSGDVGTTPDDEVIVFTYEIDVTKTFQDAAGTDISSTIEDSIKQQVKFNLKNSAGDVIKFSKKMDGETVDYFYVDNTNTAEDAATLTLYDLTTGKFEIHGLDKGTYTLVETAWPTGYNKASDTTIEITAKTVNNAEWTSGAPADALTGFEYKINNGEAVAADDYIAKANVINKKGTTLPGTGGIGTTLFYLGGGAMVAVAGIYLISKKRMKNNEE